MSSAAAGQGELPALVAAVRDALAAGDGARAAALMRSVEALLDALRTARVPFTGSELESSRASLAACLQRAQTLKDDLAERLQSAGKMRSALGRYSR